MTTRRFAAALAAAALIAGAVPATASAAPMLPPLPDFVEGLLPGSLTNPNDKSRGCDVDWNSSATKKIVGGGVVDTIDGSVSTGQRSPGVTEAQLWGTMAQPNWRVVVATNKDIADYKLVVKLPAGYQYSQTIGERDAAWFAVDDYDNRNAPVPWTNALGPEDLVVDQVGTTVTVTVKGGTL